MCDSEKVGICRTELGAESFRSEPLMIVRRRLGLLVVKELAKSSFLFGAALQKEKHAIHGLRVCGRALIELGPRERMDISLHGDELIFVDGLRDASGGDWSLRCGR